MSRGVWGGGGVEVRVDVGSASGGVEVRLGWGGRGWTWEGRGGGPPWGPTLDPILGLLGPKVPGTARGPTWTSSRLNQRGGLRASGPGSL